MSPDTARARPRSKLARKRLTFTTPLSHTLDGTLPGGSIDVTNSPLPGLPDSPRSGGAANVLERGDDWGEDSELGIEELGGGDDVSGIQVEVVDDVSGEADVLEVPLGVDVCRPALSPTSGDCNNIKLHSGYLQ